MFGATDELHQTIQELQDEVRLLKEFVQETVAYYDYDKTIQCRFREDADLGTKVTPECCAYIEKFLRGNQR